MPRRNRLMLCVLALSLPMTSISCDSFGGLLGLLGRNVRVIIDNQTAYKAVPDIRTSSSRNLIEDIFTRGQEVRDFGDQGTVPPRQVVTFYLPCEELEHIAIDDVEFRDGGDHRVGAKDANASLRRDSDFDCGDTIRITLSGGPFSFKVDVDVEQNLLSQGDSGNRRSDREGEDMADLLDRLFGH